MTDLMLLILRFGAINNRQVFSSATPQLLFKKRKEVVLVYMATKHRKSLREYIPIKNIIDYLQDSAFHLYKCFKI